MHLIEMQDKKLIEAILFIAAKPLSLEDIKKIAKLPENKIKEILEKMKKEYEEHGIRLLEKDGLYELHVKDEFLDKVEHLAPDRDFSRAILQTLSLIAFKSPVKQSDVVKSRGNRAYGHVKELASRGFIKVKPKGHTRIIEITSKFLGYFGLSNIKELKEHFAKIAKKKDI